jgi:hypothetical protein
VGSCQEGEGEGGEGTPGTREGGEDTERRDSHSARKFRREEAKATAVGVQSRS